jgi:hypothetical protein
MNLVEAIVDYGRAKLTPTNDWYAWKVINLAKLPDGVFLPVGNQYLLNVALKLALSRIYAVGDDETKIALTHYYIVAWGGIRKNGSEKMRSYSLLEPKTLILNGVKGIASWSKALCVRNPAMYAIYDARVSLALNCIQKIYQVDNPLLFPLLKGQNNAVNSGTKRIKQYAQDNAWPVAPQENFYSLYNATLTLAAIDLQVEIFTLEMLLFSLTLDLFAEAFPGQGI